VINQDHVIVKCVDKGEGQFVCLHCGATYTPRLPVALDMWLAMADEFTKKHQRCEKRSSGRLVVFKR